MMNATLSFWSVAPLPLLIFLIVLGIPVLLIILFLRYLSGIKKERQRLRLELGKLADELEQVRKQTKGGEKDKSSAESR